MTFLPWEFVTAPTPRVFSVVPHGAARAKLAG